MIPKNMTVASANVLLQKMKAEIYDGFVRSGVQFDTAAVTRELKNQWMLLCEQGNESGNGAVFASATTNYVPPIDKIGLLKSQELVWFTSKDQNQKGPFTLQQLVEIVTNDNSLLVFGPTTNGNWISAKDCIELRRTGIFDKKSSPMETDNKESVDIGSITMRP